MIKTISKLMFLLLFAVTAHAGTASIVPTPSVTDSQVADALTISGGTIDNSVIGGTTAAAGTFTTIKGTEAILNPRVHTMAVNCEINYSAGTITISGKDGVALSATNPCEIGVSSNSSGVVARASFTSNVTATDGATSQTDGNIFGITDANWASAMPMFLGVIYNGTTPYFTLSRLPFVVSGAANTDMCQLTDTDCDAQTDVMILTTGLTLASFVNLPITQVGWLSATYATTGGAWTFAETAYTGFNQMYETQVFTFPQAQNGAAAGTHYLANGGTAPLFTTDRLTYQIWRDGNVKIGHYAASDPGTDGAGAVAARVALPFTFPSGNMDDLWFPIGYLEGATTISSGLMGVANLTENTSYFALRYLVQASASTAAVTNAMFSNGSRNVRAEFTYNALSN